jgi:hypothetical protein
LSRQLLVVSHAVSTVVMECLLSGDDRKFANCNGVLSCVYNYGMQDLLGARYNQQGDQETGFVGHKNHVRYLILCALLRGILFWCWHLAAGSSWQVKRSGGRGVCFFFASILPVGYPAFVAM